MGGKITEMKLTAQCLVHCAVYYCLFFIGTIIIINHVWFKIQVFEASYSMCILIFLLPCQQGCFKGCISKCVVNSSRPWGSDTCIHIQLPPGATFNDHNTWIFKRCCTSDVRFEKQAMQEKSNLQQKVRLWHDANAKFTTFMQAIARVGLTNTH